MQLETIESKLYKIRRQQVILDFDLAELYKMNNINLNLLAKTILKRYPNEFIFQLNKRESEKLKLQIGSKDRGRTRSLPYAFTEQGIVILNSIIKSIRVNEANNAILFVFTLKRPASLNDILLRLSSYILPPNSKLNWREVAELLEERIDDDKLCKDEEIFSGNGSIAKNIKEASEALCFKIYKKALTPEEGRAKMRLLFLFLNGSVMGCKKVLIRYSKENKERGLNKNRKNYNNCVEVLIQDPWTPEYVKDLLKLIPKKTTHDESDLTAELAEAIIPSFLLLTKKKNEDGFGLDKTKARKFIIALLIKVFPQSGQLAVYSTDDYSNKDQALKKAIQKIEPLYTV